MTSTVDRAPRTRQVYFHDPLAPPAARVVPSVFVAVRGPGEALLLVRRCDSGAWELPGGQVDVGETALQAAVREAREETGVAVSITGLAGLFTDPGHVISGVGGEVRQQFALVFRARAISGAPHGDQHETSEAAWVLPADLDALPIEAPVRIWIAHALAVGEPPYLS